MLCLLQPLFIWQKHKQKIFSVFTDATATATAVQILMSGWVKARKGLELEKDCVFV